MRIQERNATQSDAVDRERSKHFPKMKHTISSFVLTFVIAFATWIVLSGKFDPFHLSLGLISCLIVSFLSHDILFPKVEIRTFSRGFFRFLRYLPWLLYQVFIANIHVMYLVLHPRMIELIDPRVIQFKSKLTNQMSHFIFANSITLTPGTITVSVSVLGDYSVHAIDKASGDALPGEMEKKIFYILDG